MDLLKGIPVSPGVVIGRVFVLDDARRRIPRRTVLPEQAPEQRERLDAAFDASRAELERMRDRTLETMGEETAKIFAFHLGMLYDPSLTGPMYALIDNEHVTAEYAAYRTFTELANQFRDMPDPTFRTKVDDVRDLAQRVLGQLIGGHAQILPTLDHRAVVIARDLTPSQTAAFDRRHVIAFATDLGGRTSHTAIFARAMGIPAVVGLGNATEHVEEGTTIIVDGDRGVLVIDPDEAKLAEYEAYIEQRRTAQVTLAEAAQLPSVTKDNERIELLGNIEFPEEITSVCESGGTGVGLYRTEFLYLTANTEPTEEEHYQAYKRTVELLDGRPLTLRTVDLGADKYTQQQQEEPERNPFLGLRSIRYCLRSIPMFKRQLRAILRASAHGKINVMFPLVTTTNEFRQGRYLINDVMEDLDEEGIGFDPNIKVGMMVEVPSAAIMADTFAREADFFSIGTNDLIQYTLAVDRTNERVAGLYSPAHPAVIRLIRDVVRAGKRREIPVSCCGESAGEPEIALLLIGLGLRTLSVTASSIPGVKRLVRSVSVADCERVAKKAISLDSDIAVTAYLRDQARKVLPDAFDGRSAED